MSAPVLIGVHGVKQSGKGAFASYVSEWCSSRSLTFRERGFADKVKWIFARQFFPGISMKDAIRWVDTFKESREHIEIPYSKWQDNPDNWARWNVAFRDAVRQFSTEGIRDLVDKEFWVDQLLPWGSLAEAMLGSKSSGVELSWMAEFQVNNRCADVCVITDERFKNENYRVRSLGGINVKIRRTVAEDAIIEEAKRRGREIHRSELGLPNGDFDYVIGNNGSLDSLRDIAFAFMDEACLPLMQT
jgi:hypothetical protein